MKPKLCHHYGVTEPESDHSVDDGVSISSLLRGSRVSWEIREDGISSLSTCSLTLSPSNPSFAKPIILLPILLLQSQLESLFNMVFCLLEGRPKSTPVVQVGIDYGTTYTGAAIGLGNSPEKLRVIDINSWPGLDGRRMSLFPL